MWRTQILSLLVRGLASHSFEGREGNGVSKSPPSLFSYSLTSLEVGSRTVKPVSMRGSKVVVVVAAVVVVVVAVVVVVDGGASVGSEETRGGGGGERVVDGVTL